MDGYQRMADLRRLCEWILENMALQSVGRASICENILEARMIDFEAEAKANAWRTPQQLAARRAQRQKRVARRCAFEVAGCAPSQDTMDAIDAEYRAAIAKATGTASTALS